MTMSLWTALHMSYTVSAAAETALKALRAFPEGENAARIGSVTAAYPGKLVVRTPLGGRRVLQKLTGAQLPRIC